MEVTLILPNQLFEPHPAVARQRPVVLAEDPHFLTACRFHRQKLVLHRASLQAYRQRLVELGYEVTYLDCPASPSPDGWGRSWRNWGPTAS